MHATQVKSKRNRAADAHTELKCAYGIGTRTLNALNPDGENDCYGE